MNFLSLLPRRCLQCGWPSPSGVLCPPCSARFQPCLPPDPGLGPCPVCGQVRLAESGACTDCSVRDWSFSRAEGLFTYQERTGELLRGYKFLGLAELVKTWAAGASRLEPPGPLIPVPPLRRHLWKRGWDPVATLVRTLGTQTGLPVWKVLARRPSAAQKSLDRTGRLDNAHLAYVLRPGRHLLAGLPVAWLVDDVVTTGSTVEACSRLLRDAGVAEVRVFCLGLH